MAIDFPILVPIHIALPFHHLVKAPTAPLWHPTESQIHQAFWGVYVQDDWGRQTKFFQAHFHQEKNVLLFIQSSLKFLPKGLIL